MSTTHTTDDAAPAIPAIFLAQMKGMLSWYRAANRDYTDCLKEKAVADRACKTWEETVERAMSIAREYGALVANLRVNAPDLLTDEERAR